MEEYIENERFNAAKQKIIGKKHNPTKIKRNTDLKLKNLIIATLIRNY